LVAEAQSKFGTLDGVVHLACVVDDGLVFRKEARGFRDVLRPKIAGTLFLDDATRGLNLDLFLMFSSVVSITGNAGQGDYCAACRFQDVFAETREKLRQNGHRTGRTLTVAWSQWERAGHFPPPGMLQNLGLRMIAPETGVAALLQSLQMDAPFVVVIDGEKDKIHRLLNVTAGSGAHAAEGNGGPAGKESEPQEDRSVPSIDGLTESEIDALLSRLMEADEVPVPVPAGSPPAAQPEAVPRNGKFPDSSHCREVLLSAFQRRLKLEVAARDLERPFSDFGLDSISAVKLADDLQKALGLEINPKWFWDYPTLAKLGTHLSEQFEGATR
jgi:acyl carrier protein